MEIIQSVIQYILNLGSMIFVPLIILILGLIVRMSFKDAFISALTLGVAFAGMDMLIGFMAGSVSPASEALAEHTGVSLPALDLGGAGTAAIVYSWPYAFLFFGLTIALNVLFLIFRMTKTMNVDMWSVWSKALTAYIVYYTTGNLFFGIITACFQIILELKMGDMFQPHIYDLTGIPLVTVPNFVAITTVLMFPLNRIMDYIPFFNKKMDAVSLKLKLGIFLEDKVMGFIIGLCLGFAGGYTISGSLTLGVQIATALSLFPIISKMFMEALSPLADAVSEFMKTKFKDREIFIGVDWPILAGSPELWVTVIVMVPVFILYAIFLPNIVVLPIAGVMNISLAVSALLITGGNLARMLVLGIVCTPAYLYGATFISEGLSFLGKTTNTLDKGVSQVTMSSADGPLFRMIFSEAFSGNILGIIGAIVFLVLFWLLDRTMKTAKVPSCRYEK